MLLASWKKTRDLFFLTKLLLLSIHLYFFSFFLRFVRMLQYAPTSSTCSLEWVEAIVETC